MKRAKPVIAFVFLVMLFVTVACAEYDLARHLGFLFSAVVSFLVLVVVIGGLFRAPEGYEDENGFHIRVPVGIVLR